MKTISFLLGTWTLAAGTVLCAASASAAGPAADAQARYRQDMAVCNSGQSNQDPATCRVEARNALAEARRGGLTAAPDRYQSNAMQRCGVFKDADRSDCEARMQGQGNIQGSVAAGGILRESVTVVPPK
ncbi:MAG: hypothetical protein H7274_24120 [Rhodoferax sp.]|nr:hypothetical protein [Rhodoferax sp.]